MHFPPPAAHVLAQWGAHDDHKLVDLPQPLGVAIVAGLRRDGQVATGGNGLGNDRHCFRHVDGDGVDHRLQVRRADLGHVGQADTEPIDRRHEGRGVVLDSAPAEADVGVSLGTAQVHSHQVAERGRQ